MKNYKITRVLKYATGQRVPKDAIYLSTVRNGRMQGEGKYYVYHYFLVSQEKTEKGGED